MLADDAPVIVLALDVVEHQVLGDDDVAFHADDLGHMRDATRAVAQAGGLDDHVDRSDDDLADGLLRQREAAHRDHGFDAVQAFARAVRVDRAHRAIVAGVHRLQQVEHLGSAHFADDDAFGAHAQAVLDPDRAWSPRPRPRGSAAGFQADDMRLLQLQFGRVLAGDDALFLVDVVRQAVEERRLAGARTAGDDDVAATRPMILRTSAPAGEMAPNLTSWSSVSLSFLNLRMVSAVAVDGERRRDDVDAAAVGRRASQIGELSSTRRPTWLTMRWQM